VTWRLRDLIVDGFRNVTGSPIRSVLLGVAAAGIVGALVVAELSTTDDLLAFRDEFVAAGGNVVVASNEQGLPAGRCAALQANPGIVATAAVALGEPVEVDHAPGTLFQTGAITTGGLALFAPDAPATVAHIADRWIVGTAAADELGLTEGMWLTIGDATRKVGAVIDTETRNPQIARWILTIIPAAGTATQCWVEYEPGAATGRAEYLETVFADTGDGLITRPWIRLDEFARDPITELASRPQAGAWLPAGLLLAVIAWLATWFRRSHIGLYRAVGTTPTQLLILGAIETVTPLVVGAAAGFAWATASWVAAHTGYPTTDQLTIALRTTASVVLLTAATAPLLWPITARQSIAQQLKDR